MDRNGIGRTSACIGPAGLFAGAAALLGILPAPAQGQVWTVIDDFQSYTPGEHLTELPEVRAENGWETRWADEGPLQGWTTELDPHNPNNIVLRGAGTDNPQRANNYANYVLPPELSIQDGNTGTLFFRTMVAAGNDPSHAIGLGVGDGRVNGDWAGRHGWTESGGDLWHRFRDGNSNEDVVVGDPNVWYNVWVVFDNANKTYDGYVRVDDGMDATVNDRFATGFAFDNPASGAALDYVFLRIFNRPSTEAIMYDLIAIDPTSSNLTLVPEPGAAALWIGLGAGIAVLIARRRKP